MEGFLKNKHKRRGKHLHCNCNCILQWKCIGNNCIILVVFSRKTIICPLFFDSFFVKKSLAVQFIIFMTNFEMGLTYRGVLEKLAKKGGRHAIAYFPTMHSRISSIIVQIKIETFRKIASKCNLILKAFTILLYCTAIILQGNNRRMKFKYDKRISRCVRPKQYFHK